MVKRRSCCLKPTLDDAVETVAVGTRSARNRYDRVDAVVVVPVLASSTKRPRVTKPEPTAVFQQWDVLMVIVVEVCGVW